MTASNAMLFKLIVQIAALAASLIIPRRKNRDGGAGALKFSNRRRDLLRKEAGQRRQRTLPLFSCRLLGEERYS
jgi:hypothetical protein